MIKMGENVSTLEIKKRELREELSRKDNKQNKFKIKRLLESIKRHKDIAKAIKRRREKWFIKNRNKRRSR